MNNTNLALTRVQNEIEKKANSIIKTEAKQYVKKS